MLMLAEEKIAQYIKHAILPLVQADGGEVKLEGVCGSEVTLILLGECSRCNISETCFKTWILEKLCSQFGKELTLKCIRKKPYFWDK
jgi:Fe-S cluster biogenesis protein NfuA